jgi:hypothetical protein
MTSKKFFPAINYTARDFNSIKEELVEYAKRYYPNTFRDFNEAGFGALMLDTVAYIGDISSFYLDYSANESFLDTALEYDNILKLGRQMGFRFTGTPSSTGIASLYIIIPANFSGLGPDDAYIPILQRGTALASSEGTRFILNEDIDFSDPSNEVVVAKANEATGMPTHYAIKTSGQVISGEMREEVIEVGAFEKFRRIELSNENITEIVNVFDSEGHPYFEVDFLSQDIVFKSVTNRDAITRQRSPSLLKPVVVPRRFIVERERLKTFLQFGFGSERDTTSDPLIDPSTTVLNFHSQEYVTETSFDPTNLLGTDKLGISPANTKLRIVYRANTTDTVNISSNSLISVADALFQFDDINSLDPVTVASVRSSLEVSNDDPIIGDVTLPTSEELKIRIYDTFASQNRAVTQQDYRSIAYKMAPQFGAIKRVNVFRDPDSNKRNVNLYVISEDANGNLETPNTAIKQNLKTWINRSRMINDTVDIFNAKIANIKIEFTIIADLESNKYQVLSDATSILMQKYSQKLEIGEPFFITDIYNLLNEAPGVVDASQVKVKIKRGGNYSTTGFDLDAAISPDGRFIKVPQNVILELKYPESDIVGSVK